jgi:hypothetical protein
MKFNEMLNPEEQAAISVLEGGGFLAFTDARLNDVRELGTGLRRRTFRNRGRYDLVLACRKLADRKPPGPAIDPGRFSPGEAIHTVITTTAELREAYPDLCRKLLEAPTVVASETVQAPSLRLVAELTKEELLTEARMYPSITGEYKMNKGELAEAVQAERNRRREILHRRFTE